MKRKLRIQKVIIFFIAFSFMIGLIKVDEASSDMVGEEGILTVKTSRMDQDFISISFLGKEAQVNTTKIKENKDKIKNKSKQLFAKLYDKAREIIKVEVIQIEESPHPLNENRVPFPLKTL